MRQVSSNALKAMLSQYTDEVFIPLLSIDHESFDSPVCVCYNTEAIVSNGVTYNPYPFTINLPDAISDQLPQVTVTIDNTDLSFNDAIRTLSGDPPTVTFSLVLASSPDTIEIGPLVYSLVNATVDTNTIQGVLGFEDDIFSQQVPNPNYTPSNSPGLFR